jgi:hypothetical protein
MGSRNIQVVSPSRRLNVPPSLRIKYITIVIWNALYSTYMVVEYPTCEIGNRISAILKECAIPLWSLNIQLAKSGMESPQLLKTE